MVLLGVVLRARLVNLSGMPGFRPRPNGAGMLFGPGLLAMLQNLVSSQTDGKQAFSYLPEAWAALQTFDT